MVKRILFFVVFFLNIISAKADVLLATITNGANISLANPGWNRNNNDLYFNWHNKGSGNTGMFLCILENGSYTTKSIDDQEISTRKKTMVRDGRRSEIILSDNKSYHLLYGPKNSEGKWEFYEYNTSSFHNLGEVSFIASNSLNNMEYISSKRGRYHFLTRSEMKKHKIKYFTYVTINSRFREREISIAGESIIAFNYNENMNKIFTVSRKYSNDEIRIM